MGNLLVDLVTVTESVVRKSAGRNGEGLNLMTATKSVAVIKSVCLEICWQKLGRVNILGDLVTLTTSASKEICCRNWEAVNLLSDLVTVTTSASQEIY